MEVFSLAVICDTCSRMYLKPLKQTLALNPPLVTLHRISNLALIPQNLICVSVDANVWGKVLFCLHGFAVSCFSCYMGRDTRTLFIDAVCICMGPPPSAVAVSLWAICRNYMGYLHGVSRAPACVWWRFMGCCCTDVTAYSGLGKQRIIYKIVFEKTILILYIAFLNSIYEICPT